MLLSMFTLPDSHKQEAFQLISLTVVGVFPFVSLLVGKNLIRSGAKSAFVKVAKRKRGAIPYVGYPSNRSGGEGR